MFEKICFQKICSRAWVAKFAILSSAGFLLMGCSPGQAFNIGGQDIFSFGAQESCHFNRNSYGVRISWKNVTPITVLIHKSVPTEFDSAIIAAANRWNSVKGKKLISVYRDEAWNGAPSNDKINGIFWLTEWEVSAAKEQARTTTKYDLSRIIDSDIRINAKNFSFYSDVTSFQKPNPIHLESLMVHEFGHALGLQHFSDTNGVMPPTLKMATSRSSPSLFEIKELGCEY